MQRVAFKANSFAKKPSAIGAMFVRNDHKSFIKRSPSPMSTLVIMTKAIINPLPIDINFKFMFLISNILV